MNSIPASFLQNAEFTFLFNSIDFHPNRFSPYFPESLQKTKNQRIEKLDSFSYLSILFKTYGIITSILWKQLGSIRCRELAFPSPLLSIPLLLRVLSKQTDSTKDSMDPTYYFGLLTIASIFSDRKDILPCDSLFNKFHCLSLLSWIRNF